MTTPTSMGNHGGTVTSCSPYAYPRFAEICILLRTWSTVAPGTYELAFLIKKKTGLRVPNANSRRHTTNRGLRVSNPNSSRRNEAWIASPPPPLKGLGTKAWMENP